MNMKNIDPESPEEWTNRSSLCIFNNKQHLFYHIGNEANYGRNRKVCIEEIEFDSNGKITNLPLGYSETGSWDNVQQLARIKDDSVYDYIANIRIQLENKTGQTLTDFKVR